MTQTNDYETETNWEVDKYVARELLFRGNFCGLPHEMHHGHVSWFLEQWNIGYFGGNKWECIASNPGWLYQLAGSFFYRPSGSDYQYLSWGKGKAKYEEMTEESYDEFIRREIRENGKQPWMSSDTPWTLDEMGVEYEPDECFL